MKRITLTLALAFAIVATQTLFAQEQSVENKVGPTEKKVEKIEKKVIPEKTGAIERAALSKLDYMIGEWEGEGWSQYGSGQRQTFWVKEYYQFRGDKDLMDMEGRSGGILPDGTKLSDSNYSLGIMYYNHQDNDYRMWHYNSDGGVFDVKVNANIEGRNGYYIIKDAGGEQKRFSISIDNDEEWISKMEVLTPANTWLQVLEFRMKRIK
jgi:hypothetical protein